MDTRRETERWWRKGRQDRETAKILEENDRLAEAAFFLQQAVEKSFKALLIEEAGDFPRIHDLVALGRRVGLPDDLLEGCKELSPAYTYTRYPDVVETSELEGRIGGFFNDAEEVMKWVEKRL